MAGEVVGEIDDRNTIDMLARLGLPSGAAIGFLSRVTANVAPHLTPRQDEETLKAIGDIFIIGVLIGHKTAQWQTEADAQI